MFAEPGHARHAPLIALYRETGLFAWSAGLRQLGAESPARVVFIIDSCLREPGHGLRRAAMVALRTGPDVVLPRVLARAARRFGAEPLCLQSVAPPAPALAEAGWDAHAALAELMAVEFGPRVLGFVRDQLWQRGLKVQSDELHDLAALFANIHLRGALSSFDPTRGEGREAAWLGTVFFRYALRQVLATRQTVALADWLEHDDLPDTEADPQVLLEQRARQEALDLLPRLLGTLPQVQRHALALYYGFQGREHTVAEVAQVLGTNEYFARTALVSGLGALAAASGTPGVLLAGELVLARAVFLEGRSVEQLARAQGRTPADVRQAVSAITRKLQSTLRRRTRLPKLDSPLRSAPVTTMAHIPGDHSSRYSAFFTADVSAFAAVTPALASPPAPARVRDAADASGGRPVVPDRANAKLDEADSRRDDLRPGDEAWLRELDLAAARSLANLVPWLEVLREQAEVAGVDLKGEEGLADDEAWLHVLSDGASATTAALEELLPRTARRAETVLLVIEGLAAGSEPVARLEAGDWRSEQVPLHALLSHRLGFAGGLSAAAAEVAATSGLQVLAERSSTLLPGFVMQADPVAPRGRLVLRWLNPLRAGQGG